MLFALLALFLVITSVFFTSSGDAPDIFGKNIYIVQTNAFSIVNKGDAILTSSVPFEQIHAGNIVIYQDSEKQIGIAEIHSSELTDEVFSFKALNEQGAEITLSQGQIIGKAMQTSGFLGGLINFAKAPQGVLVIAVLPCISVLIYEAVKSLRTHFYKEQDVNPVKKQDEVPTFIPRQKIPRQKIPNLSHTRPSEQYAENGSKIDAIINTYAKTALNNTGEYDYGKADKSNYPLFVPPVSSRASRLNSREDKPKSIQKEKTYPVSQKRLNEVIAETNAKRNISQSASSANQPDTNRFTENPSPKNISSINTTSIKTASVNPSPIRKSSENTPPIRPIKTTPEKPLSKMVSSDDDFKKKSTERKNLFNNNIIKTETDDYNDFDKDIKRVTDDKDIKRVSAKTAVQETVKRYAPKKTPPANFSTETLPRLDEILKDDSDADNMSFDIGDILSSLEKKN